MSLLPTSRRVAAAWLRLALPDVTVGEDLPPASADTATAGFVRYQVVGGSPERYLPVNAPVVAAECWLSPDERTRVASWSRAEQLASRIVAATYDPALVYRAVDLGDAYAPARVFTVVPLGEPARVLDPGDWARVDVTLLVNWRADA